MIREFNNLIKDVQKRTDNFTKKIFRTDDLNLQTEELKFCIIRILGQITKKTCNEVFDTFSNILKTNYKGPILILINSLGGEIDSANCISNLIKSVDNDVYICIVKDCGSAANIIYLSVDYDHRYATEDASFLIHPPKAGDRGIIPLANVERALDLLKYHSQNHLDLIKNQTNIPKDLIEKAIFTIDTYILIESIDFEKYKIGKIIQTYDEIPVLKAFRSNTLEKDRNKFKYYDLLDHVSLFSPTPQVNYTEMLNDIFYDKPIMIIPLYPRLEEDVNYLKLCYSDIKISGKRVICICFGEIQKDYLDILMLAKPEDRYMFQNASFEGRIETYGLIKEDGSQPHELESLINLSKRDNSILSKNIIKNTGITINEVNNFLENFHNSKYLEEKGIAKIISSLNEIVL